MTNPDCSLPQAFQPSLSLVKYHTIDKELKHFAQFELSWYGRLVALKINIFPQIFRSLSIPIANHYLISLSGIIKPYLWKGKRARCPYSCLTKHKTISGAGLPDLKDYYWVALLDQLKHWFPSEERAL